MLPFIVLLSDDECLVIAQVESQPPANYKCRFDLKELKPES